ncbi:MAG: aspartyl/asparaginyl beta-hydroxylase domain-containing protein [Cyanobacteria bacterium P01_G01_bin.67]
MKTMGISPFQIRELIVKKIGKNLLWGLEKVIARYSLVANTPFLVSEQFPWVLTLEQNWQVIRDELDVILEYADQLPRFQDISPDQGRSISKDNLWKTFFLYGYGVKMQQNCNYCPETTRIIEQIPGLKTAFFSILLPGKHIPEHRGPYKGVLRCHLALKVPEAKEQCGIRVEQEVRHWQEGKAIVFDDSYPHEAWNKTDEVRVVLFLDIVRPMMFPASLLNHLLINLIRWSPFIRDAEKNQQQWDQKIAKVFDKS